jgi:hypothetical protein
MGEKVFGSETCSHDKGSFLGLYSLQRFCGVLTSIISPVSMLSVQVTGNYTISKRCKMHLS